MKIKYAKAIDDALYLSEIDGMSITLNKEACTWDHLELELKINSSVFRKQCQISNEIKKSHGCK